MNKIVLITFLMLANLVVKAQLTEKNLKLNRIVVLDSTKAASLSTYSNATLKFTINVPTGVYWKLKNISLAGKDGSPKYYFYVNQAIFYPDNSAIGNLYISNNTIWIAPNSTIKIYQYVDNPTITGAFNLTLYLNAEEYFLE